MTRDQLIKTIARAIYDAECPTGRLWTDRADGTRGTYITLATAALTAIEVAHGAFKLGDRVRKTKGSSWQGRVVGFYSTSLTPVGYAVESEREPGSVQIYPVSALEPAQKDSTSE